MPAARSATRQSRSWLGQRHQPVRTRAWLTCSLTRDVHAPMAAGSSVRRLSVRNSSTRAVSRLKLSGRLHSLQADGTQVSTRQTWAGISSDATGLAFVL